MTATGLSTARSLGRKGIEVFGIDSNRQKSGIFSRYVKAKIAPDAVKKEQKFIDYLIDFGKKLPQPAILFCTADEYLTSLSRNREKLYPYFKFNIPSREIVEDFLDKRRSYAIARKYGLLCPPTYFVEDTEELEKIAGRLRFPCALKPAISHLWREKFGGKKLIPVDSYEELLTNFSKIKKEYPQIMVQEIVPGGDDRIYALYAYFNRKSEAVAFFIKRKLRQYPIHFGIASFNISEMNEQVKAIGLEFLTKIKYTGPGALELKRDSRNGEFKFIELNMRFLMSGALPIASGVDLPYIMYRDIIGEETEKVFSFKEGVKLVNLEIDLGSFWQYRKAKELTFRQYLNSFKGGKLIHTYFAWDDPGPSLFVSLRFARSIVKKILSRTHKKPSLPLREIAKWGYSFIPLKLRNGRRFFKELEFLDKSQWWSGQELQNYQNEKLRKLIKHAYENVPYYHKLFEENRLKPDDIKTIKDLPKIPILTKEIARKNLSQLIAVNLKPKHLKELSTSGTTGEPFHFYVDKKNEYLTGAPVQWRYFGWGGCKMQDTRTSLDARLLKPHSNGQRRLFQYNPISKCLFLSINDLSAGNLKEYIAAIEKHRPLFFKTYPSALEVLIGLLKKENIKLSVKFKTIFTSSEILYPWQRSLFEDYFDARVLDWYGLEERVLAATECEEHTGYHISSEYGIVEFASGKDYGINSKCFDIIATGLTNFGMPLIRYEAGDLGFPVGDKCKCGRGLPLMKLASGRKRDFAVSKNGSLIPIAMMDVRNATENIRQFQFVQERRGSLFLNIVKKDSFSDKDLNKIKMRLNKQFGGNMDVAIRFTDAIQRTNSKTLMFIQKMRGIVNNEIVKDFIE